jgi:hypothetical protein
MLSAHERRRSKMDILLMAPRRMASSNQQLQSICFGELRALTLRMS